MPATPTPARPVITPFLWFDGQAEQAAAFYTGVFKSSRILGISRAPAGTPMPQGSVMTVDFELDGQRYTALNGGPGYPFTMSVSFVVHCDTQAEIDEYWEKLISGGGKPVQCGWLEDRFGLSWQVIPRDLLDWIRDPARSERVMAEVMKMVKLDLATLKAAAGA